jgi:hypothetical protein
MNFQRKEGESELNYIIRLVNGKNDGIYDIDYVELFKLAFDVELSSCEARKRYYGIRQLIPHINNEIENNITNDLIKKIQEVKREVYKERQKLRDEKNEYNAWLRSESRTELFYERIDEASNKLMSRKVRIIPNPIKINNNDVKLVIAFADAHYDENFKIEGLNNDILNEYNIEIFKERMIKLRDEVIDFALLHNIKELYICDMGDVVSGLIHVNQLKSLKHNIVDAILDYADFIEEWLNDLSMRGFYINFYTSEGNHSDLRLLGGKKGDTEGENLEKIYSRVIYKAFKDNQNIIINKNIDGLNLFTIHGFNFLTNHGQNDSKPETTVSGYEDTYNIKVNYYIAGHLHSNKEMDLSLHKEFIQLRSIMGLNVFSKGIRKTSKAGAKMFTVHKGIGKKYTNDVIF